MARRFGFFPGNPSSCGWRKEAPEDLLMCSQLPKVPGTEEVFGQCVVSDERLGGGGRKGKDACTLRPAGCFELRSCGAQQVCPACPVGAGWPF